MSGTQTENPWRIGPRLLGIIQEAVPPGGVILELGSGEGTGVLAREYAVVSVEHDPAWLRRYESQYIYAPIVEGWYCVRMLNGRLPARYDLLLIDGPPSSMSRYGRAAMIPFLDLFNLSVPIVIDDVQREMEMLLARRIGLECGRPLRIYDEGDGRKFAYVPI